MAFIQEGYSPTARPSFESAEAQPLHPGFLFLVLPLLEFASIVLTGISCGAAYDYISFHRIININQYLGVGIAVGILFSNSVYMRGLYSGFHLQRPGLQIRKIVPVWTLIVLSLVVLALPWKGVSLPFLSAVSLFLVGGLGAIIVLRYGAGRVLASVLWSGMLAQRRVVVVTRSDFQLDPTTAEDIALSGRQVCRTVALLRSDEADVARRMSELIIYVRRFAVDEILLALDWTDASLIETIVGRLRMAPVPVRLMPDPVVKNLFEHPLLELGRTRAIELQRAPLTRPQRAVKRMLDLVLTLIAAPLVLPMALVIALAIVVDSPGPVLFRQRRVGFNGREFRIYKFRTMRTLEDGNIIRQASQGDARVTRVGRILRKLSIDELPQLLNVLKGEMSLVGPRPHALAHDSEYGRIIGSYDARHNVKPGITGWAQVNGWRGATPHIQIMMRRVEHDLWYVEHWSLWLDMKILLLTLLGNGIFENAY